MEPILTAHFLHRQDYWRSADIQPMMAVSRTLSQLQGISRRTLQDPGYLEPQVTAADELIDSVRTRSPDVIHKFTCLRCLFGFGVWDAPGTGRHLNL